MSLKQKITEIEAQKKYCLDNAQKAIEQHKNPAAEQQWKAMAEAYEISLQILTETGDWFPEEKAKAYIEKHEQKSATWTVERLEHEISKEHKKEYEKLYHEHILSRLRIDAYKNVQYRKAESEGIYG